MDCSKIFPLPVVIGPATSSSPSAAGASLTQRQHLQCLALLFLPQRLRCLDAQGAAVGEKPAAQGEAAGQDPGRQVDLQRMGMAVADRVGRQHPGQLRMYPVGCGALGRRPGLRLLGRPFQTDLVEGEGKLSLANGGVGLALAGQAQDLQLAAALLAAGLAETLLGCEVITQLDATAVMKQPLQPGERGDGGGGGNQSYFTGKE